MAMSGKRVRYMDMDVVGAAKLRLAGLLRLYDFIGVNFSGGKDSMVVAHLLREVYDEAGLSARPVELIFNDEEVIPEDVVRHVASYRERPGFRLHWLAFCMVSELCVMGEQRPYVQWDPGRVWVRPKPDWAVKQIHPAGTPLDQSESTPLALQAIGAQGKAITLFGIRAQESWVRFRACNNYRSIDNWKSRTSGGKRSIDTGKPIYDWSERDVFKYFYDRHIDYGRIYDAELYAGAPLRVSTPLHQQAYQYQIRLRKMYPEFWDRITQIFPDVLTHERYWRHVDRFAAVKRYPASFDGMRQYVRDTIADEEMRKRIMYNLKRAQVTKDQNRRTGVLVDRGTCYGMPLLWVWRCVISGDAVRPIQSYSAPTPEMIAYEREAERLATGLSHTVFEE